MRGNIFLYAREWTARDIDRASAQLAQLRNTPLAALLMAKFDAISRMYVNDALALTGTDKEIRFNQGAYNAMKRASMVFEELARDIKKATSSARIEEN